MLLYIFVIIYICYYIYMLLYICYYIYMFIYILLMYDYHLFHTHNAPRSRRTVWPSNLARRSKECGRWMPLPKRRGPSDGMFFPLGRSLSLEWGKWWVKWWISLDDMGFCRSKKRIKWTMEFSSGDIGDKMMILCASTWKAGKIHRSSW